MSYLPQDIPTSELGVGIEGVGVRGCEGWALWSSAEREALITPDS